MIATAETVCRFSIWEFTEAEMQQIVRLVTAWSTGEGTTYHKERNSIDQRKFRLSKSVLHWALSRNLVERDPKSTRLLVTAGHRFSVIHDMPVEILWRLVEPMLEGRASRGYSIVNDHRWRTLGLWEETSVYAQMSHGSILEQKRDILNRLMAHHYVIFQYAGNIWDICRWER